MVRSIGASVNSHSAEVKRNGGDPLKESEALAKRIVSEEELKLQTAQLMKMKHVLYYREMKLIVCWSLKSPVSLLLHLTLRNKTRSRVDSTDALRVNKKINSN